MCGSLSRLSRKLQGRAGRGEADEQSGNGCALIRPELGTYLVGAISPRDREVLVRHLAACDRCRDELAGLAALPGLLRRVPKQAGRQSLGRECPPAPPA
jgi:anti-sigma factor RsiW